MDATVILVLAVFGLALIRKAITPDRRQAVLKMCSIPLDWREKGTMSRLQLARRAGIQTYLRDLTVEEVMDCLDRHPRLIEQWELDIADRRGSGGWAYSTTDGGYPLSEIGEGMASAGIAGFKSRTEVCAVFVLLSTASYLKAEIPAATLALERARLAS